MKRIEEFPGNHLPPSRSSPKSVVLGPAPARHFYEAACRVLAITQHLGAISCPADLGVHYHLYFSGGKAIVGAMTYDATGCEILAVGKGPTNGAGGTYTGTPGGRAVALEFAAYRHPKRCDPFLSDLAGTMGLTRGQLRP
ncbi:MAG: hypothetical protein ACRD0J_03745 [Acidimicrobiales bacterium]